MANNPITTRISNAWNAFLGRESLALEQGEASYGGKPPYGRLLTFNTERSVTASIYNRIALDAASVKINHVRVDENSRFTEVIDSDLNKCLSVSANIDQTSTAFMLDVVMSLFDEGIVCIVPVDTTRSPVSTESYDIQSLRVGRVTAWYPKSVTIDLYNDRLGKRQEITLPKSAVAIVENPFYSVMNEANSTLKRLIRKLALLDVVDEATSSGKLDLIIQLPYLIKNETRRDRAEKRRAEIEEQLTGSKYGIAYTDGTEKVIQLNRPAENNLMDQIEYLASMLYSQLGLTTSIMDGTADEKTMLNYYRRTIEPVTSSIINSMGRNFISKTGYTQGQRLMTFVDIFKLASISDLAEAADKFTRNEVVTGNEFRGILGLKPSSDPRADELKNKNMPEPDTTIEEQKGGNNIDEA